jgi:hypothetical protein
MGTQRRTRVPVQLSNIHSTNCKRTTASELLAKQCAVKGAGLQRVQLPPGNWFAPPSSNRGGSGGNKAVGALGVKGRLATPRACRP